MVVVETSPVIGRSTPEASNRYPVAVVNRALLPDTATGRPVIVTAPEPRDAVAAGAKSMCMTIVLPMRRYRATNVPALFDMPVMVGVKATHAPAPISASHVEPFHRSM